MPLLKDVPWAQSLTFNAAGRYVNYSTSGGTQYYFTMTWYFYQGNWWLALGNDTYLQLVNQSSGTNAVYANTLIVPAGCTLDLNNLHLYVDTSRSTRPEFSSCGN